MKKMILSCITLLCIAATQAQVQTTATEVKYRRSSLYTVMIDKPGLPYSDDIKTFFNSSPTPDKFNDHNLEKRVMTNAMPEGEAGSKKSSGSLMGGLVAAKETTPAPTAEGSEEWNKELNQIAKDLVAKWFNRSAKGGFNMDLIKARGSYDASVLDIAQAKASKRGLDMLSDAGEELIQKTFVLVNDFKYISKEEVAEKAKSWLKVAGSLGEYAGVSNASAITDVAAAGATVAGKGYVIKTKGHLYQLEWNEEVAAIFYNEYWADDATITPAKKKAFDESTIFKLKYIGTDDSWADVQSTIFTKKSEVELVQRATLKAMDAVIVKLQKEHDEFKTKTPLFSGEPIAAKIGLKEGLSDKSKFDVLEQQMDADGKTKYVVVGSLKVDTDHPIWDNRFGANEENPDSTTDKTYFKKVSGKEFYPGMLIVQKKGK